MLEASAHVFRNLHIHTLVCSNMKKRHEFEREKRVVVPGRAWKEVKEWEKWFIYIIISKKHFYKKKRKLMVKKFQLTVKRFHPKWDWEWAVFKLMCFYLLSVWCDVCGHGAGVTGRGKFCGVISRLPHLHEFPGLNVVHQAWASAVLPWWLLLNMSPDEFLEVRERDYRWASQTLECTQIIRNDTL